MRIEYASLQDREIILSILNDIFLSIQEVSKDQAADSSSILHIHLSQIEDQLLKLSLKFNHDKNKKTLSLKK